MPSSLRSRRRFLASGAGVLAATLAGCAGDDRGGSSDRQVDEVSDDPSFESTHEYETLFVRADDDERFVYRTEDEANEAREEDDDRSSIYRRSTILVLEDEDATELWVDPDLPDEDDDSIQAFLEETDFATQSVVVLQRSIEDCYDRQLLGVQASDDEFRTSFCRSLKDPMTPCEADRELMEAVFVRVHRPYEDRPSSRGSSEHMSCRRPPHARSESGDSNSTELTLDTAVSTGETDE